MKIKVLTPLLACACLNLARADFNPITLTPDSYTFDIVVEASTPQPLPDCIDAGVGSGYDLSDHTFFEQGLYARPGQPGGNCGVPPPGTVFTNVKNSNITYVMPPDYTANDDLLVDSDVVSVSGPQTLTFATPTTATNLSLLVTSGGGAGTADYTVTHADSSTETGSISVHDWYGDGEATVAWGCNGRVGPNGGYDTINTDTANIHNPCLYGINITVSDASPVTSITFDNASGGHLNFFGVSGNASGATWTPIPVDPNSFTVRSLVPAAFPLTATMDQGTNTQHNGNLATWFEQGFDRSAPSAGLPPSGSQLDSLTQPSHHYQLADYTTNNGILIDTNHQLSNIALAAPASYSALSFLTAGGDIGGGNTMTNVCIIQHADGVNETNLFYGYDWFDNNHPGAIAFKAGGRVNMSDRTVNQIGNNYPYLFESYFLLNDTASPVTNIVVMYQSAPAANATTFVMAISGTTGPATPIVGYGPVPLTQTLLLGTNATFTVGEIFGTPPLTGYWEVQNDGVWVPLTDGPDANGSIVSGSQTTTLTISNLFLPDGTNYQYVAQNGGGSGISSTATLTINPQAVTISPANPQFYTSNNIPLTVNLAQGPAVNLQWYYIDPSDLNGTTNFIPDATNVTYTIVGAPLTLDGFTYGVIATNAYGTNTAQVGLHISDSSAFLAADLTPLSAETYAGAPVTYAINAQGNSPITYQWLVNGTVVNDADGNYLTLNAPCGETTVQVLFTNALSGGNWIASSVATLQGDPYPTNVTFNTSGDGWTTNGSPAILTNNTLVLTTSSGGGASSAYFNTAQYVGGAWTASFTYNSHGGGADGAAFVLQNVGTNALGGGGGDLGYAGVTNSLAFELNLYNGNTEIIGITLLTNGLTGSGGGNGNYHPTDPVNVAGTDPINVKLDWNEGVLAVSLMDTVTGDTYSTNYVVGSLVPILGGNAAYIGFSGASGGVTAEQWVSDFSFHSVLPPVVLSASPVTNGSFILSWPAGDSAYKLQTSTSLSSPVWVDGPTPVEVDGVNHVTVDVSSGGGQQFYRLVREVCQ